MNDPLKKKIATYPIHKLIFAKAFATKFLKAEQLSPTHYEINTFSRFIDVFGVTKAICFNRHNDVALSCPVMIVTDDIGNLERGNLVLSLESQRNDYKVFFPARFEDEDMEPSPLWELVGGKQVLVANVITIPERLIEGLSKSIRKGDDYVHVRAGSGTKIGDYIMVRGKSYEVMAISDNAFTKYEGQQNVLKIVGEFANNVKRQNSDIGKYQCFMVESLIDHPI